MTATQTPNPPPIPRARSRWRQRWHRMAVPFAAFLVLVTITSVAHRLEEPNLRDADTLSPTGTGPDGSSQLAELLTAGGVQIEHVSEFMAAVEAVESGGDAVVFIPKPNLFAAVFASIVADLPGGRRRIVLVAPQRLHLGFTPVRTESRRWASAAVPPGCDLPEAVAAGRATALRSRYVADPAGITCYQNGLVRTEVMSGTELFVVGANDPFRNRRIGEHGNATLAVELLSAYDRVIWVGPLSIDFDLNPQLRWPQLERPSRPEQDRTPGSGLEGLVAGYPPGVLAGLALAALLALLIALARARRLGPPVSEPLPVVVPAAEAVAGRGRLYQRTRGRAVALAALRVSALRRLLAALGLPAAPAPEPEAVVAAITARTGLAAHYVRHTLYGPEPDSDQELANAVAALDGLVETVVRENPGSRGDAS